MSAAKTKEPKKITKTLQDLHDIVTILEYYMVDVPKDIQEKLNNIEDTIHDLAIDRKEYNRRLIPRLKERWKKELEDAN